MVNIAGRRWPFSLLSENREKDPAEIFFFFIPFKKAQQLVARWLFGNGCHAADTTSQWLEAFDWPRDRAVLLRSHLVANLMPLLPRESNASYLAYVCGGEERKRKEKKKKSADWDAVCTILGWKWQSHGLNRERKRGSTKRYNDDDDIEASWWLPPIHHHPLLVGRSIHCDTDCLFPGFSRGREEKTASSDFLLLGLRDCRWVLQNEVTPPRHNTTMTSPRAHRETSIIPRIPLKNSLIERREPRSFLTSPHTHIGPLLCVRVKATTRHFSHPANPLISPFKDRRSDPLSLSSHLVQQDGQCFLYSTRGPAHLIEMFCPCQWAHELANCAHVATMNSSTPPSRWKTTESSVELLKVGPPPKKRAPVRLDWWTTKKKKSI